MKKIIVISGPTASGKTQKAVEFCKKNNGEIISCDSRQVYKYLDIGTNKEGEIRQITNNKEQSSNNDTNHGLPRQDFVLPRNDKQQFRVIEGINQYLTDIINPDQTYNAADFVKDADIKINEIISAGKLPVITGGTGLYIKSLLYGLDEMPAANAEIRESLKSKTADELYELLVKRDREAAEKNKQNPQRLLRALEINILSGKNVSQHYKPKTPRYDFIHYTICVENEVLYKRINDRCLYMLENGMLDETREVLDMGYAKNCPGLSGIGYRHIIKYFDNEISKDILIEEFSKDTRHYAKRQNTWFKAQPDIQQL
ncbi:MAG: tRNA (adenosine(37)-N6)-dimethylallyltransferase MiaA [Endomicrobia bacterium]|nr:tRNA (adenosine(37)-N6)-dimethylallyltransferase MiaA [Endomicrobiia bacterium]MCL2506653.1 tRNA (adenosine(37)-N6)-dimethylallyltransferase MiaA [Endomicrobiia bacterium]